MTSGIYKLDWDSGYFYIGKSDDIERRWKQHETSFLKGKHSQAMQRRYNMEGPPNYSIVYEVHSDHIDLVEGMLIEQYISHDLCLNTTKGKYVPDADRAALIESFASLKESTADHLRYMRWITIKNVEVETKLADLEKDGVRIPKQQLQKEKEQADQLRFQTQLSKTYKDKIDKLMARGLFQRIFNTTV